MNTVRSSDGTTIGYSRDGSGPALILVGGAFQHRAIEPVLVIDGGASPESMHSAASALATLLPDAGQRTIEGQLHDVDPALLAPVLRGFFAN